MGIDVRKAPSVVRSKIGVVPQETALYDDLSALENLQFHARLYRVPRGERQRRIDEVLELVGLSGRRKDRVGTFSGGMQRRLALARALLTRPDINAIQLLTQGGPFAEGEYTRGGTDILISMIYRIAFGGSGADYGFASAVSVILFIITGVLAAIQFRATRALEDIN